MVEISGAFPFADIFSTINMIVHDLSLVRSGSFKCFRVFRAHSYHPLLKEGCPKGAVQCATARHISGLVLNLPGSLRVYLEEF